jgi:hypothetical protein
MMVSSGRPLELEHRVPQAHKALAEHKELPVQAHKVPQVPMEHRALMAQVLKAQLEQMALKAPTVQALKAPQVQTVLKALQEHKA